MAVRISRPRRFLPSSCRSSRPTPRSTSVRRSPRLSSPSRRTSTTHSGRQPRMPDRLRVSRFCGSSTSRRPRPLRTDWTRRRPRPSSSGTLVVEPSTCQSSKWVTVCSRSRVPPVTRTLAVTTMTSGFCNSSLSSTCVRKGLTFARTSRPCNV